MTTLTKAYHQWASRPADEKFSDLPTMNAKALYHKQLASEHRGVRLRSLEVVALPPSNEGDEPRPQLLTPGLGRVEFSHWSFGQVCSMVGAPAEYLRELPAGLVAQNLNHGIVASDNRSPKMALIEQNGATKLRALNGEGYARIWNHDITKRLVELCALRPEWQPAPEAFDGSRGLYLSDQDMFAFLVDNDRRIFETLSGGLSRGFFVWNSEVGGSKFGIMTFNYEWVCGNHRVWGARNIAEVTVRHVGSASAEVFEIVAKKLVDYRDSSTTEDEAKIKACVRMKLGVDKDEVLDAVFNLRQVNLSRKVIEASFDLADEHSEWYGDPRSVWGFTGGLTEYARDLPNGDERVKLDREAGKIMALAAATV
jgi:hypothetical protein